MKESLRVTHDPSLVAELDAGIVQLRKMLLGLMKNLKGKSL